MRIVAALLVLAGVLGFADAASASGAYRCCFIDANSGIRYIYQGRASSLYKGTIDGLCIAVAKKEKAKRCDSASAAQVTFDFFKGRRDYDPDTQPDKYNLSWYCEEKNCAIGLTVNSSAKLSVSGRNKATCKLANFTSPKNMPGASAYTLLVSVAAGKDNTCELDIDGKKTAFFIDKNGDN